MTGEYKNFQHYIDEGWAPEPKQSFLALRDILRGAGAGGGARGGEQWLDVGCAAGELIGYLATEFPNARFTGADVFDPLLEVAASRLPGAAFENASVLALPAAWAERFDVVTAIGCMSIFDERELVEFWDSLFRATRPGGLVVVLAPLNEYGVDAIVRHRKRLDGLLGDWESGWNVFSIETVQEVLAGHGVSGAIERFRFEGALERREDPVRTWTVPDPSGGVRLTNGLKLLVDHYFITVRKNESEEDR